MCEMILPGFTLLQNYICPSDISVEELYKEKPLYKVAGRSCKVYEWDEIDAHELLSMCKDITELTFGGEYKHAIVNWYDPDDYLLPHHDSLNGNNLDRPIVVCSFYRHLNYKPRRFMVHLGDETWSFEVGHGDMLSMSTEFNKTYKHSVPKCDYSGERISIVLRDISLQ